MNPVISNGNGVAPFPCLFEITPGNLHHHIDAQWGISHLIEAAGFGEIRGSEAGKWRAEFLESIEDRERVGGINGDP
jgi:hypothetical protein